jgi:hypothetical protein
MEATQAAAYLRSQPECSMAQIVVHLGQLCQHANLHEEASFDALLHKVAELKFDENVKKAPQNFVGAEAGQAKDSWPLVAFPGAPFGNPDLSKRTIENRNTCIRQVYRALGTTQPFGPPYKWLGDCPKVINATRQAYPISKNSFRKAAEAIVCLCAATAQPTLRESYEKGYAPLIEAMVQPTQRPPLTLPLAEMIPLSMSVSHTLIHKSSSMIYGQPSVAIGGRLIYAATYTCVTGRWQDHEDGTSLRAQPTSLCQTGNRE